MDSRGTPRRKPAAPRLARAASARKLDHSTGYLVRKTYRAFTRSLEHRLRRHGISISMWFFLRLLWEKDGATQKELSDQLGLMQPTTVTAMDNMEKLGFIVRRRNAADRRKVNIFLTEKGWALKHELLSYAGDVNAVALADISASEIAAVRGVLCRINGSLEVDHARHAGRSGGGRSIAQ